MFTKYYPVRLVALLIAMIALSACAPQVKETPAVASAPEPVTLRLAISDAKQDTNSESIVAEFVDQVKALSNGDITIEPVWDAGKNTQAGFETGVIQLVKSGQADIGLAASRAWGTADIKSFQALQAPFLIDNDSLAEAVASSDIATKMLDRLSEYGVTGLTLWPEDLRHPFSLLPDRPILSPADISGRNIRVTDTGISQKLIETLGGIPTTGDGGYDGAESGLRQARTLSGTPTATGNVTFFPKYQVLFANEAAFDKLSEAQQAILRKAAAAAQKKAIAEHPSEVEAGKTWCSDVGAVVLASADQIAAFQQAAQPVFDWIEQDPLNAELIAAIKELKGKTPASQGVQACETELAQQIPTPDANGQSWSTELPPNGVWQVELTNDDVIKMGVSKAKAPDWSGVITFTFKDGVFHWTKEGTEGYAKGQTDSDDGSYSVVEDFVRLASGDYWDDFQWRLDEEGLHFHLLATQNDPYIEIRAMLEARPYQKVETWSTGMPPNGIWQAELTSDDLVRMGVSKANAPDWAGVYTQTFQDGVFTTSWKNTEGQSAGVTGSCTGPYAAIEDFVRITYDNGGDCGDGEVDDIQWRIDDQGLMHFHLVSQNGKFTEVKATYEAKPYQKVENWSTGLLPNGVWQVTLTGEDVMRLGVSKANSAGWSGVTTFTFQDGIFNVAWQGTEGDQKGRTDSCDGTYRTVNDYVSLMFSNDCGNEADNIQWRIDKDGLHFHVLEVLNGMAVEVKAVLEAKPFQKISDN